MTILFDHVQAANIAVGDGRGHNRPTYVSSGRDIDFAKASPGQQASALLRLLLRQTAGRLIIDQPEDDLDDSVLMEIVELVRRSKTSRQLIFTIPTSWSTATPTRS